MELVQSDPELEAFERLRVREVRAKGGQTAAAFLAEFQSTAASLQPDERIKLVVYAYDNSMKLLKAVLSDPQANKICSLHWEYSGEEDVNSIVPLLISNCPELASLEVEFEHPSEFDFVSSLLEHPSNKIKVFAMLNYPKEDLARFFAALGQSQVSALALNHSPEFAQSLCEYLARDLLVRLKVWMGHEQVPSAMMVSLATCTRLAKLEMSCCKFSHPIAFPKSITKLGLKNCTFVGGFDWSFLADSNVQKLDLLGMQGVDGHQLGDALAAHLRAKGLGRLRLSTVSFTDEILAAVGVELGRIKRLDIGRNLNDASVELIALALQSPNSEMKELVLTYNIIAGSIKTHLVTALKHPNCNLAKLSLSTYGGGAKVAEDFHNRLALFVLLQGRQLRRWYCPLRRLPVEMFRLVGKVLI
ncbi:hypothetical protein BASA81_007603 [Batrachochytrium salamandrivorans]|nr:hypothetical protein BASA81_007603 [Batrachochytrium salamandrivorans]